MDRKIIYPGQIPLSAQHLAQWRNDMIGLGWLAQTIMGATTIVDGLDCQPSTPVSLTVNILPGAIYEVENIDAQAYGGAGVGLGADARSVIKQGINLDAVPFTLAPPAAAGQAVNYLIQATFTEVDGDLTQLPYVNVANPSLPFAGPNNSGVSQPTTRKASVALSSKAGVAAVAGSQETPTPDDGKVGLYAITVAYGATTIDANNIVKLGSAPFLFKKLPEIPAWVQGGSWLWASADTGTKNAIKATVTPAITAYTKGQLFVVKKMATANDGNLTADLGGGVAAVLDMTGAQIASGNAGGNYVMMLAWDGTAFRWINGSVTNVAISSITATSGEGIQVGATAPFPVSLNFPNLGSGSPTSLDLFAFYDHEGGHHLSISWSSLLALIEATLPQPSLANIAPIMHIEQQRGGSIDPPAVPKDTWNTRVMNTVTSNQIPGASLNTTNGQITLPPGTYRGTLAGIGFNAGNHRCRLYNLTDGVEVIHGLSADSHVNDAGADPTANASMGTGRFAITDTKIFVVQHIWHDQGTGRLGDTSNVAPDYHVDAFLDLIKEA